MCYDELADHLVNDTPDSNTPDSKWQIQTDVSSNDVYLYLTAEEPFTDSAGQTVWPTIWLRCKDDTTAALIAWDVYLGEYEQSVLYRVDSQPAHREWWEIALSKEVAGLWTGDTAIPFIKQLFGAQRLLVRVSPNRESAITATFQIGGLEQAIEPLRRACLW
jgi:type VI secretion system protein VasI